MIHLTDWKCNWLMVESALTDSYNVAASLHYLHSCDVGFSCTVMQVLLANPAKVFWDHKSMLCKRHSAINTLEPNFWVAWNKQTYAAP